MEGLNELKELGISLKLEGDELQKFIKEQQAILREERLAARQKDKEDQEFRIAMEKLELEKENAKKSTELEREKEEYKIRLKTLEYEHEKEILEIRAHVKPAVSTPNIKGPKLPPFEEDKDEIDSYLKRFEVYAAAQKWKEDLWATHLSALLKGRALDIYAMLPTESALDYNVLKQALLKRYEMTEEGFKTRFRSCRPESGETFGQFADRQSSYLARWVEMAGSHKTFDSLFDLMSRDQFMHVCSKDLRLFLKERIPKTVKEMAELADQYKEARNSSAASLATPVQSGRNAVSAVSAQQNGQGKPDFNRRPRERRCFICDMTNHIARDCRNRSDFGQRANRNSSPSKYRSNSPRPDFHAGSKVSSPPHRVTFRENSPSRSDSKGSGSGQNSCSTCTLPSVTTTQAFSSNFKTLVSTATKQMPVSRGHPEKTEISDQEFNDLWDALEKVLLRLGHSMPSLNSDISNMKLQTIDPSREAVLEEEIANWKQKYDKIEDKVTLLQKRTDDMYVRTCMQEKQDTLEQSQLDLKVSLENLVVKQHVHEQTQDRLQEEMKQKQTDIVQINKIIREHDVLHQSQAIMNDSTNDRLCKVERKVHKCHGELVNYKTDHERLRDRQEQLNSQELNQAGPETATENLQRTLLDLYKDNCQQVPIYLPRPTWKHPVKDLYVNPELKVVDHRGKRLNKDDPYQKSEAERITITDISDMFYSDGNLCRNIYISGEPGTGKSTFCEHLVQLWCDAQTATDKTKLDEDKKMMLKFKLLFYINLRDETMSPDSKKCDQIATIIYEQLELSRSCAIDDISGQLSNSSTLVIMDSLDEMKSKRLPYRGLHNKSCAITTSRPWKLEVLRSQLEGKIDKQIEVVGLTHRSPNKLADNVVKILNEELRSEEKDANDFIQKVLNEGLDNFLSIPILMLQMLSLWYDGESFGNSQYEIYGKMIHYQILAASKAKSLPFYKETKGMLFPICCLDNKCPCRNYAKLLWKVAEFAYNTLFSDDKEASLVFDHEVTELSSVELDVCLKIGILTQHRLQTRKLTKEKRLLSFLHKTNQEYFAASYLCLKASGDSDQSNTLTQTTAVTKLKNFFRNRFSSFSSHRSDPRIVFEAITDLDRALELKEVLLFYFQRDKGVARSVSRILCEKVDDDKRVHIYRNNGSGLFILEEQLLIEIQDIILKAIHPSTELFLADILIYRGISDRKIRMVDMSKVKSLLIKTRLDERTWNKLKECKVLQKLVVYDCGFNTLCVRDMVLGNIETLRALEMKNELLYIKLLEGKLFVHLYFRILHGKSALAEIILALLDIDKLATLDITCVDMSHAQCQNLVRYLSTMNEQSELSTVFLKRLYCAKHGYLCVFESLCDEEFIRCNIFVSDRKWKAEWQGKRGQEVSINAPLSSEDFDISRCVQKLSKNAVYTHYKKLVPTTGTVSYTGMQSVPHSYCEFYSASKKSQCPPCYETVWRELPKGFYFKEVSLHTFLQKDVSDPWAEIPEPWAEIAQNQDMEITCTCL